MKIKIDKEVKAKADKVKEDWRESWRELRKDKGYKKSKWE